MGTYTTAAKVRRLYPKLDTVTSLSDNEIDFYITQAEAEIDAHLVDRYSLPFSTTPPLVETVSTEYALIKLLDRFFTSEQASKSDWRTARREAVMDILKRIQSGELPIVDDSGLKVSQRTDIYPLKSSTSTYTPTFNHLGVEDQRMDPDRLDDEEDAL